MRYSEILGLKWTDCNFQERKITVRAESSKSGKSRLVPINEDLFAVLKRLKGQGIARSGHVFTYSDPRKGRMHPLKTIRRAFVMACKRAEIKHLTFHDLRHTVASRLVERGVDPVAVMNLLGHASLKTTQVYLHSSLSRMREAVALLATVCTDKPDSKSPGCHQSVKHSLEKFTNVFISDN